MYRSDRSQCGYPLTSDTCTCVTSVCYYPLLTGVCECHRNQVSSQNKLFI